MRKSWIARLGMAAMLVGLGCAPQGALPSLRVQVARDDAASAVAESKVSLRISLPSSYQVQSLSWAKARLTLSNANSALLPAPRTQNVTQAGGGTVTEATWVVRSGTGYDLKVWLYDAQDRLVAAGMAGGFELKAGPNSVTVPMGPAILAASYPPVASTGDVLTFEGSFGPEATVTFPGLATPVAATLMGMHRAQVTVPAGVSEGPVTLRTGGRDFASRGLTVMNKAPALTSFKLAGNTSGAGLFVLYHTSFNLGTQFYVAGDFLNGHLYRASRNSDGTLGAFQTVSGVSMARDMHDGLLLGNYYYLLGGTWPSGQERRVLRLPIRPDGQSIDPHDPHYVNELPQRTSKAMAEVIGRFVYVLGGGLGRDVYRAPITSENGDIGAFESAPGLPFRANMGFTSEVIGRYLYVLGSPLQSEPSVRRARIRDDGSLEEFTDLNTGLPALTYHQSVVLGSHLYVLGGEKAGLGAGMSPDVWRAPILPSGDLGTFAKVFALPAPRSYQYVSVSGRYVYLSLGDNADYTLNPDIHVADVGGP